MEWAATFKVVCHGAPLEKVTAFLLLELSFKEQKKSTQELILETAYAKLLVV